MALINGALQIGRSAITASQAALSVTGNNMANAATPGYTRQNVHLAATQYTEVSPGKYTGTGVVLYDIKRQIDDALNGRIRTAVGDSASYLIQQQAMTRVESAFNELTEEDLSSRLNSFFNAFSSLQTQPHDMASRNVALQEAQNLTNFVTELRSEIYGIQQDLDDQVKYQINQTNILIGQVAELNEQIVSSEAGRAGSSSALRDQRDELLKQLSELVNITTREVEGGSVNVFIGNEPVIQYSDARLIDYKEEPQTADGTALAEVVFADNEEALDLTSGKLFGMINARDEQVGGVIDDLDSWTDTLMYEVNQLHSLGRGLNNHTSLTSEFSVDDTTAALMDSTATGLNRDVTNGTFTIHVFDTDGNVISTETIKVDAASSASASTLDSLIADINAQVGPYVTASADALNRLKIDADTGYSFAFSAPDDTDNATNVLAVMGINSFFQGKNASDISVNQELLDNPRLLAVSANGLIGNGDIAGRIADLALEGVSSLGGVSIVEAFNTIAGQIATDSKASQDNYTAAQVIVDTLEVERESISGVSMDEEAIHLITYQRAFQGASRYVSIIDQMLEEVLGLIR